MARRATVIQEARRHQSNTLLLEAGNALMGDPEDYAYRWEPAKDTQAAVSVEALNRLGYDVVGLGEKDLALGLDILKQRIAEASFSFVSANVIIKGTGEPLTVPMVTLEVGPQRVAVIGLTGTSNDALIPDFTVTDPLAALESILPEAEEVSDTVFVLSTVGREVEREVLQRFSAVSLIVSSGEARLAEPLEGELEGIIVHAGRASSGHAGLYVGIAHLAFGGDHSLLDYEWQSLALRPEVADDADITRWLQTLYQ